MYFSSLQVFGHEQAIALTKAEASGGTNPAAVTDARVNLPVLEKHLKLAESAHKAVKR
ncbi:MAG: hypothetical protein WAL63_06900 [Solirubrobacteraceae bacterium]